ncbi:M48 family metalloprotease [Reichenbachiella faecimaris]|uniref:M48 family metalloprotease n=1 Tax=Reichenbachiella faecimaris TaxID=692418 RepID=UPI001FE596A4|nr:M48 family metalloprotease [Reichenbachiella faecimaris]
MKIIDADVLNAFATPGGFIYVYTGLIKYLDTADDLAGVMGHEIAHASERHSSDQMKQQVGLQLLSQIILGEASNSQLAQLATGFFGLKFSRDDEAESDEHSVIYLSDTEYACNGAATFFEKLTAEGQAGGPEFLSTHPSPTSRVADINAKANDINCSTDKIKESGMSYDDFKASLP